MELTAQVNRLEEGLAQLAAAQARTEEELRRLAAAQTRTETRLEELAAAQARTEAAVAELARAQARTEEAQARTEEELRRLAHAQADTQTQLGALLSWQTGEDGRRKGERFERELARRAPSLFQGGEGGSPDRELVQRRMTATLAAGGVLDGTPLRPEDDPFLADLIWWKGDRVALVEASLVVDEHDVDRAVTRAATVRRAGVDVLPIVIGDAWDSGETRVWAAAHRVAWKIGPDLSQDFIGFLRSRPAKATD